MEKKERREFCIFFDSLFLFVNQPTGLSLPVGSGPTPDTDCHNFPKKNVGFFHPGHTPEHRRERQREKKKREQEHNNMHKTLPHPHHSYCPIQLLRSMLFLFCFFFLFFFKQTLGYTSVIYKTGRKKKKKVKCIIYIFIFIYINLYRGESGTLVFYFSFFSLTLQRKHDCPAPKIKRRKKKWW